MEALYSCAVQPNGLSHEKLMRRWETPWGGTIVLLFDERGRLVAQLGRGAESGGECLRLIPGVTWEELFPGVPFAGGTGHRPQEEAGAGAGSGAEVSPQCFRCSLDGEDYFADIYRLQAVARGFYVVVFLRQSFAPRYVDEASELEKFCATYLGTSRTVRELVIKAWEILRKGEPLWLEGPFAVGKRFVVYQLHRFAGKSQDSLYLFQCAGASLRRLAGVLPTEALYAEPSNFEEYKVVNLLGEFQHNLTDRYTFLLHEPGSLPQEAQSWVARLLEAALDPDYGGKQPADWGQNARPWIVVTSSESLDSLWCAGRIHPLLYLAFRNAVLRWPALKDRPEDIPFLVRRFVDEYRQKHGHGPVELGGDTIARLVVAPWPGNIAQLKTAIMCACARAQGPRLLPEHLPPELVRAPSGSWESLVETTPSGVFKGSWCAGSNSGNGSHAWPVEGSVVGRVGVEPGFAFRLEKILREVNWNVAAAARKLGVSRTTLYKWMRRCGLGRPEK